MAGDSDWPKPSSTWEEVCIQHLWRRLAADDLPVSFAQLGRYWDSKEGIDLVGLWRGQASLVGECNWTSEPVDIGELEALQRKALKLPLAPSSLWVLASRSGFTERLQRRAGQGDLLLLEPGDLFSSRA